MGGPIPAWGLYRLLKGIEPRAISGHLDVATADGPVTFGLKKGRIYQAESDVPSLGFGSYLVRARMVTDPATAERLASTRRLVDAGIIRPEDASKLHGSYARSVLSKILPLPCTGWSFTPTELLMGVVSDHPVDPFPELLRAVTRDGALPELRAVVDRARASGSLVLAPGFEFALSHAKSHFGELKVLFVLRQGRTEDITDEMLAQDDTVRVLFSLVVAGLLHAGSPEPGAAVHPAAHPAAPAAPRTPGAPPAAAHPANPLPEPAPAAVSRSSSHRPPPAVPQRPTWMGPQDSIQLAGVSNPFEKELRNAWNEMQSRNHFEVLGVPVDARDSAIVTAHSKARAQFARAKYDGVVPAEALDMLDRIHRHLDTARDILLDRTRRSAYNRQVGVATPSLDSRIVEIHEARVMWHAGVEMLQAHKAGDALAQFEAAARQDPHEPEYKVFQAWAILALPPAGDNLQRAQAAVEEAAKVEPDMVEGLVCQATIARLQGRADEAREFVRRALVLEPDHVEARAVKDLLRARTAAPKMNFQKSRLSLVDRVKGLFKKGS